MGSEAKFPSLAKEAKYVNCDATSCLGRGTGSDYNLAKEVEYLNHDDQDQEHFAFMWEDQQYTFTHLPQGFKYSSTLAYHTLAQELSFIPPALGVKVYQYTDDILVAGDEIAPVRSTQTDIIKHLESLDLQIPPEKVQPPSQ
ncbi:hypothetical protein BTVI_70890 [Pitangus sulphuratus]|nr:hypothetical protein BTVI_70890 [Pitangus sulphuratus]